MKFLCIPDDFRRGLRGWLAPAAGLAVASLAVGAFWSGRPERWLAQAERCLVEDRPEEALDWLTLPGATPRTRERALILRARVALARGRPSEAVRPLNEVDPKGPSGPDAAFWKGRTLYAAHQTAQAIAWFREAAASRPRDPEVHRWLAAAAYDLGARRHAMGELETVVRLCPTDANAWRTMGVIHREDGRDEEARQAYLEALRLDPNRPDVRLELAEVLLDLGRPVEAEAQLTACKGRVRAAEWDAASARGLLLRGDLAGSRAALASALSLAPDHPGLLARQAELDLVEGRVAEAVAHLDRAVALDPHDSKLYHQRSSALRRLGRVAESDADLARTEELRRAIAELTRLTDEASRRPDDADLRHRVGTLWHRLGKPELATTWYLAALAIDPEHASARRDLAGLNPSARGRRRSPLP